MITTTEAAERLADRLEKDAESPKGARYQPYTDSAMRDASTALRALAAERDALKADLLAARFGAVAASENAGRMMEERNAAWQEMEGLKAENANLQDDLASAERERAHQHGRADRNAAGYAREQKKREQLQAENARLREAIEMARECLDDRDVIGASLTLTKALGEKDNGKV